MSDDDLTRAWQALKKVRELHQPTTSRVLTWSGSDANICSTCTTAGDPDAEDYIEQAGYVLWPCPTRTAADDALRGDS